MPESTADRLDGGAGAAGTETVRWYTRAFRIPRLIGKTHTGTPLWGGPYTIWQALGFGAVLVLGFQTMALWARFGLLVNGAILIGTAAAAGYALGQLPLTGRNPVLVLAGLVRAVTAPRYGTVAGRPLQPRSPRCARAYVRVRGWGRRRGPSSMPGVGAGAGVGAGTVPVRVTAPTPGALPAVVGARASQPAALLGDQALRTGLRDLLAGGGSGAVGPAPAELVREGSSAGTSS